MSEDRADELWEEASALPNGMTKISLLEEAIREADSANYLYGSFHIREALMEAAAFSGAGERLLAAFSWCLGKCDEMPDEFDDHDLLWEYKWSISSALEFPGISLQQIDEMLDDFEARLLKHGYSLRPANNLRMRRRQLVGALDEARTFADRWQAEPRDDMADCEACELDNAVELLADLGDDRGAISKAEPITSGKLKCAEVPHRTLAQLLLSAMRAGDEEAAKKLHLRGYRMVYRDPDFLRPLGIHGVYLARTKDFKKGVDLMEKHLGWSLETLEASNRRDFHIGCLALLRAMQAAGMPSVTIKLPDSHPLHSDEGACNTQQLADWFDADVHAICDSFNERNGNDWHSQVTQQWLSLA